jgi:hypothetical protein
VKSSGIEFVEVPALDARSPSTALKQKGRSTFQVELLAPGRGEEIGAAPAPEFGIHAVTLPYFGYLLEESQVTALLAREGCSAVRVPVAERFAIHKLIVSQLRRAGAKSQKDQAQALVLCAAVGELDPGALESAVQSIPLRARKHFQRARLLLRDALEKHHPRAWDALNS